MTGRLGLLLAIITVTNSWPIQHEDYIGSRSINHNRSEAVVPEVHTKTCTPNDFDTDGTCTLKCTISTADTVATLVGHTFIYYSVDPKVYVTLYDAQYTDDVLKNSYTASLTLTRYSAGYYQCQWLFNVDNYKEFINPAATFKINTTTKGIPLNSSCDSDRDCATLNATCATSAKTKGGQKICNCAGAYHISFSNRTDSPACLPSIKSLNKCSADAQCREIKSRFICRESICVCPYTTLANPSLCNDVAKKSKTAFLDKLSGQQILILSLVGSAIVLPSLALVLWSLFHYEGNLMIPTPFGNCLVGHQTDGQGLTTKLCPCCSKGDAEDLANGESDPLNGATNGEPNLLNGQEANNGVNGAPQQTSVLQTITSCFSSICSRGGTSPSNPLDGVTSSMSNIVGGESNPLSSLTSSVTNVVEPNVLNGQGVNNGAPQQASFLQTMSSCLGSICSRGASTPLNFIPDAANGASNPLDGVTGSIGNVVGGESNPLSNLTNSVTNVIGGASSPISNLTGSLTNAVSGGIESN